MSRPLLKQDSVGAAPTGRGRDWRRGVISMGIDCSLNTKDLKKLAQENNVPTYGRKGEIVERLLAGGVIVPGASTLGGKCIRKRLIKKNACPRTMHSMHAIHTLYAMDVWGGRIYCHERKLTVGAITLLEMCRFHRNLHGSSCRRGGN